MLILTNCGTEWYSLKTHFTVWNFLYLASSLRGFVVGEVHSWTNCNYCYCRSWQIGRVLSCTHIWYLLHCAWFLHPTLLVKMSCFHALLFAAWSGPRWRALRFCLTFVFLSKLWSSLRYSFFSLQHHFSPEGSKLSTVPALLVTFPYQPLQIFTSLRSVFIPLLILFWVRCKELIYWGKKQNQIKQ